MSILRGARVLVPVTERRRALADRLSDAGMQVDEVEFIAIAPSSTPADLAIATARWCSGQYDWMAVTSRNAVTAMAELAATAGTTLAEPQPAAKVATVGESTVGVCVEVGLDVSLLPSGKANAAGIVADMPEGPGRVLAPLGNLASPVLTRGLERKGWTVDAVEAYRTVDGPGVGPETIAALRDGDLDAVLLTSGSVAERFAAQCPDVAAGTRIVAIGATTAASAVAAGLSVTAVATTPSYDGIVDALVDALTQAGGASAQELAPAHDSAEDS
ncbi:uroporphyrinogen-III synthase [Demequina aurantiaca]|uniref:uroporphyrinogen-III synthase n=1 Tax=Demequina aurantiaca TaxID=676200 RepID=UPI00128BD710|nr:uroporphyrinogen-III synthase [Demequina aurantiaca]